MSDSDDYVSNKKRNKHNSSSDDDDMNQNKDKIENKNKKESDDDTSDDYSVEENRKNKKKKNQYNSEDEEKEKEEEKKKSNKKHKILDEEELEHNMEIMNKLKKQQEKRLLLKDDTEEEYDKSLKRKRNDDDDELSSSSSSDSSSSDESNDDDDDDDSDDDVLDKHMEPVSIYKDAEWFKKIKAEWMALKKKPPCWACSRRNKNGRHSHKFKSIYTLIKDKSAPSMKEKILRIDSRHTKVFGKFSKKREIPFIPWYKYGIFLHLTLHNKTDIDEVVDKCIESISYQVNDINQNHLRYRHRKSRREFINYKAQDALLKLTRVAISYQKSHK